LEEVIDDPDCANINAQAKLYAGRDKYYGGVVPAAMRGTERRVILKIGPERVVAFRPQG
jgi:hypothetical protein